MLGNTSHGSFSLVVSNPSYLSTTKGETKELVHVWCGDLDAVAAAMMMVGRCLRQATHACDTCCFRRNGIKRETFNLRT